MQGAKGPNNLNMIAYMHGEEEEQEYNQQGSSSRPNIDVKAIEDQFDNFVKQMQKYDQILSDVAKNIEEIDGERQFITDFYPKFIWESTYEKEQEKQIVKNTDQELHKIIKNLQRNNKMLKDDMRAWVLQFAKTAKNTQILIKENKILRQSIAVKNKQIVKLIEGIGQAQNEEITQLVQNLQVLKQQNGVLKQHLIKLKQDVTEKQQQEKRLQSALQKINLQRSALDKAKTEAEDEEEHLSKTFQLIQNWRNQADKKQKKLIKQKEILAEQRKVYQSEKIQIERQLQTCAKQKRDLQTGLKRQFLDQQSQKHKLIHEIADLGDLISKQKEETRFFEQQIAKNTDKKLDYQKKSKQFAKKTTEAEQRLIEIRKNVQKSQQVQVALQCQIQLQKYDIDLLNKELKELEDKQKRIHQEWKRKTKSNQQKRQQQIVDMQKKIKENQRQLTKNVIQQRNQLNKRQKQLNKWVQKVYDKKAQITDLKAQMEEIKNNQGRLAQLKEQFNQKNKQAN